MVARSDTNLSPFSRDQLFTSIHDSCKHRPSSIGDAGALTQTIITELMKQHDSGVITRSNIARTAHDVLSRFDKAAATFYAAYHPA